jgi:hypothetical protein
MTYLDNFQTINFTFFVEDKSKNPEAQEILDFLFDVPGILRLHCLLTNRTYLTLSEDLGEEILYIFNELVESYGYYENCPDLREDFNTFPKKILFL